MEQKGFLHDHQDTKRRSIVDHSVAEFEAPTIACLWMLRCLVPLHGSRGLVQKEYLDNDGVAGAVGLRDWVDRQYEAFDQAKVILELHRRYREIERVAGKCHWPETLGRNIRRMSDLIGLNEIEQAVLAFAVMIHSDKHLATAAGYLGEQSLQQLYANLSSILCLPEAHVRNAFTSRSVLSRSGLVKLDRDNCFDLKIGWMSSPVTSLTSCWARKQILSNCFAARWRRLPRRH